jgi:signal transduction histidine kinase/CheY-like chemotaxis protein/ABC-type amino acid transport substrate-binding protein
VVPRTALAQVQTAQSLQHKFGRSRIVVGLAQPTSCRGILERGENDRTEGFGREIMDELGKTLGFEVAFVEFKDGSVFEPLRDREVDVISAVSVINERFEQLAYTSPVVVARGIVVTRKGADAPSGIQGLQHLRVSVANGGIAHQWCVSRGIKVNVAGALREALRDVRDGRADACVTTQLAARVDMQNFAIEELEEHPLDDTSFWRGFALAVRPSDTDLLSDLNAGLETLRQNGRFDAIYDRTIGRYQPREAPSLVSRRDAALAAGACLALAVAWGIGWVLSARRLRANTLALRESEQQMRELAECFPGLVYKYVLTTDGERAGLFANAKAEEWATLFPGFKVFGDYRETLLPSMHPDDRERYIHATDEARRTSLFMDVEYRMIDAQGKQHWMHSRIVPRHHARGTVWQGFLLDVTELRLAQQERHDLAEQLARTQKLESLGLMAGGIAHDFNNLLTAISGQIGLARIKLDPESPSAEHLNAAIDAVSRAGDLSRGLLTFSGRDLQNKSSLDLAAAVESSIPLLRGMVGTGVTLEWVNPGHPVGSVADRIQFEQVIMNLVTNASEACGKSGLVSISAGFESLTARDLALCSLNGDAVPGTFAAIRVKDTGSGIASSDIARVFEPFYSTKFAGRGLGLAVVATIIRRHHGALRIESHSGTGSVFTVYFPMQDAATPAPAKSFIPAPVRTGEVLVVDDEPAVRRITAQMLEFKGWRCVQAADAQDALREVSDPNRRFQLVVVDVTMPGVSGPELVSMIRQRDSELPVVMMSGYAMEDSRWHDVSRQADAFVGKPFSSDDLMIAAETAMRLKPSRHSRH